MMKARIKIIIGLSIFIIIGVLVLIVFVQGDKIKSLKHTTTQYELEIQASKEKEKILLEKINILQITFENLQTTKDSIQLALKDKKIERIEIINDVNTQIKDIVNISLDSNISFISNRLSQIDFD